MRDDQRRAARRLAEQPEPALSKRRIGANYDNAVVHVLFVDLVVSGSLVQAGA